MRRDTVENKVCLKISGHFLYYIQACLPQPNAMQSMARNSSLVFSIVLFALCPVIPSTRTLCLEGERAANLVGGLVELLGIEGCANAESDTGAEENVVCNGSNTTVVDLDLFPMCQKSYVNRL